MNKIFSAVLCFLSLALVVPNTGAADQQSHRAAAEALLKSMNVESTMMETIDKMVEVEISRSPQLALYQEVLRKFFEKHMTGDVMFEAMAGMYMEVFTEQELIDITKFYKTDTGRKSIEKLPVMTKKGALWAQQQVSENLEELKEMIAAETKKLQELKEKSNKE